jgi:hypothetical protein
MRYIFSVLVITLLVTTGLGCGGPKKNLPTVQPTWEVYESEEFNFAFQYPGKYIFNNKEADDTVYYLSSEMRLLFSIYDPTVAESAEQLMYAFFVQGMTLDQFKEVTANGYGGVEGTGEFIREEQINQGDILLTVLENTTAMNQATKTNYVQVREDGLIIFSPFVNQETYWEEMMETLRELE